MYDTNSTCANPTVDPTSITVLFSRILPYLVERLLYGGRPPHLIHITTSQWTQPDLHVILDCGKFLSDLEFTYPRHVTDVIAVIQCPGDALSILLKMNKKLSQTPSPLARPNIVVVFESDGTKAQSTNITKYFIHFINSVIDLYDIKETAGKAITAQGQHYTKFPDLQIKFPILVPASLVLPSLYDIRNVSLNFMGQLMQVITSWYRPFVYEKKTAAGHKKFAGVALSVLDVLAEKHNFSYDVKGTLSYGSEGADGKWSGMVGMVQKQTKDLAVAALTITSQRSAVVDFTYPFWFEPLVAAVKVKRVSLFDLFHPLQTSVWLCASLTFIMTLICYPLMESFKNKLHQKRNGTSLQHKEQSAWYITEVWLSQGGTAQSTFCTLRTVIGIIRFCLIVFWATYTGNLIASLSVRKIVLPLNSLRELAQDTEYLPLVQVDTVVLTLFKDSSEGVYAKLWKIIELNQADTLCKSGTKCQEQFGESEHLVIIGDKTGIQNGAVEAADCQAEILPDEFHLSGLGIAMPLDSPYKPYFDETIHGMEEGGLLQKFKEIHKKTDKCAERRLEITKSHPLRLSEVLAAFIVLGIGVLTSFVIFYLEFAWSLVRKFILFKTKVSVS